VWLCHTVFNVEGWWRIPVGRWLDGGVVRAGVDGGGRCSAGVVMSPDLVAVSSGWQAFQLLPRLAAMRVECVVSFLDHHLDHRVGRVGFIWCSTLERLARARWGFQ
jgi:hypothetical protein